RTRPDQARAYWLAVKSDLTACIGAKPDFVWSHILRGYVYGELGDADAAEKDFARALALRPDRAAEYAVYVDRGTMRGQRGHVREAEADLRRAIALEPRQFQAHLNLARIYEEAGRAGEARREYDRAVALEKRLPALYRLRGRLHVKRQDAKAA